MPFSPQIRSSREADISAITKIYAHYVLSSTASFETVPPDENEIVQRRAGVLKRDLPYLIAEVEGDVAAYAYATPYRPRAAYRFTVEDSIYVHPDYVGRGIGRMLLAALIDSCEKASCRQMIAVIGGQQNAASVRMHTAIGFREVGVLRSVGFKFGSWADTLIMQRALGAGAGVLPNGAQVSPMMP